MFRETFLSNVCIRAARLSLSAMTELEVLNFIAAALHSMYDRTSGVFHYLIDGHFVCRTAFQLYHGISHYKLNRARRMVQGD
jgi:hypothetical protein